MNQSFPNHLKWIRLHAAHIYYVEDSAHLWHHENTMLIEFNEQAALQRPVQVRGL